MRGRDAGHVVSATQDERRADCAKDDAPAGMPARRDLGSQFDALPAYELRTRDEHRHATRVVEALFVSVAA